MHAFGEVAEKLRRSTVQVHPFGGRDRGSGSGVIWSAGGLILTNAHVARGPDAEIELWDGRRFPARVTARDPRRDLAALRVDAPALDAAVPGDSHALRPGELVIAVGSPLGFAGALSTGVVHSIGTQWIYADVRLAPGNSGGPLADAHGRVIGINTAVVKGLGAAIPSATALDFVRNGARPALGVSLRPVHLGLQVTEIDRDGAAAIAGLRVGDVLLGRLEDLHAALDAGSETVRVRFLRDDTRRVRETVVRIGARAEAAA
ncbi:MAG TPA: trypsin-like peptidase domain-containing protein [Candidatus Acidoferrales bacterium]|nr:trypsin-like peptidase domain-containing protein [Candidatus Acidoferrales bacterium]